MNYSLRLFSVAASVLVLNSAMASQADLSNCRVNVAKNLVSTSPVPVVTIPFSSPVVNGIGALEREANYKSIKLTIIQMDEELAISLQDLKNQTYFVTAFKDSALFTNKEFTAQVDCK